ncbi:MAG: DNA polymerase III subunit epsilon [Alphaproteobacteria bacterium]|nr:DNA polymerase III subunit epsilon [Alphaproteobacteria bacterium]OJV15757.1 MAG: DNA polymerase III subunit epsilon [Alphaproteobacteria bacterium 33-17]
MQDVKICLDTETTGLDPYKGHRVVEIGAVELINGSKTGRFFHAYINPERDVPEEAYKVHGISTEFLKDKPLMRDVYHKFHEFIGSHDLVIHNAAFDLKFLDFEASLVGFPKITNHVIDTLKICRSKFPGSPANLDALCRRFKIDLSKRDKHGALLDSELLADVYINLTGGFQRTFAIQSEQITVIKKERIKIFREAREFPPSAEEIQLHEQFLEIINK